MDITVHRASALFRKVLKKQFCDEGRSQCKDPPYYRHSVCRRIARGPKNERLENRRAKQQSKIMNVTHIHCKHEDHDSMKISMNNMSMIIIIICGNFELLGHQPTGFRVLPVGFRHSSSKTRTATHADKSRPFSCQRRHTHTAESTCPRANGGLTAHLLSLRIWQPSQHQPTSRRPSLCLRARLVPLTRTVGRPQRAWPAALAATAAALIVSLFNSLQDAQQTVDFGCRMWWKTQHCGKKIW